MSSSVVFPSVKWLDNSANSNVLRASYVNGVLDVSNEAIFRTDASLCGNVGINGSVSIANSIGMSGVINQLITTPLQGGYVYQQVATTDALTAIAQVAILNSLVISGNATASPQLAPFRNPTSGNVVTLGTSTVNTILGGLNNYVTGNLITINDVSINADLFVALDTSLNARLFVKSDTSMNARLFVAQDASINGLSIGLGSQQLATNTGIGRSVLQQVNNPTSTNNTALGYQALFASTNPINDTAIGSMALSANTTGSNNTAVGYGSGAFVTTAGNITCLGSQTGFANSVTQYNKSTAIGYGATISLNNQIVLGTAADSTVHPGNVAVGSAALPAYTLDVTGTGRFTSDVSINGNLLVGGALTVQQMQSRNIINTTTTNYQLIISEDLSLNGRLFLAKDASINGISVGLGGGSISTNAVFGAGGALANNTTGGNNCAFGQSALQTNTTGVANCAFGQSALASNTTGESNEAFGFETLLSNTTGIYNNAVGRAALRTNTTGTSNNALGQAALRQNTTGINNTAIGAGAGYNNSQAGCSYNTYLGSGTDIDNAANSWTKSTAVGYNTKITASNQITLGTASERVYVPGNVYAGPPLAAGAAYTPSTANANAFHSFVGNTSPGQVNPIMAIYNNYATSFTAINDPTPILALRRGGTSVTCWDAAANFNISRYLNVSSEAKSRLDIALSNGGTASPDTNVMTLQSNGNVGIGTTEPVSTLDVSGTVSLSTGSASNTYKNLYGKAPPTNTYLSSFTPDSSVITAPTSTWVNKNITWTAIASNYYTDLATYSSGAFGASNGGWWSGYAGYVTTNGVYQGTNYTNNISGYTATTASGDWLQLQSSVPIIMSSYSIMQMAGLNIGRTPATFLIVGSNDNNAWYPIQYVNTTAIPSPFTTNGTTKVSTPAYNIAVSPTTPQNNATIIGYSTSVNAYTYFRMIIIKSYGSTTFSLSGAVDGQLSFGWYPTFSSVATQTGPSRSLLYMDASNINQLDVSGSLALINTNPSTMTVTPNTTGAALSGWQNNNITWNSIASSNFNGNMMHYNAFNTSLYDAWNDDVTGYTATGVAVTNIPNFQTPVYTTGSSGGTSTYYGQWLQIQSSSPLVMKTFYFTPRGGFNPRLPQVFYIVGSNTGTGTWTPVFKGDTASTTGAAVSALVTLTGLASSGTIANFYGSTALTYTTYGNLTSSFTYFRLVVSKLCSADNTLNIGEWGLTFSPATSSVSMALDVGLPNQLNVGGTMNVAGTLLAAGYVGIGTTVPTYALHVNSAANQGNTSSICITDTTNDIMGLFSAGGYGNNLHIGCWNVQGSTSKNIVMQKLGGFVGIGNVTPTFPLDLAGQIRSQGVRPGLFMLNTVNSDNRTSSIFVDVNATMTVNCSGFDKMYIRPDSGVLIDNFTGQHRTFIKDITFSQINPYIGLIVVANQNKYIGMESKVKTGINAITINESLPVCSLCKKEKDKSCFGVISGAEDENKRGVNIGTGVFFPTEKEAGDTRIHINSLGEGAIWVSNKNGNLESGDYITSSTIPGYGTKQDSEFLCNYTVAKITMDCDFNPVYQASQTILKDTSGNNILDSNGEIQWADELDGSGNIIYEYSYKVRYILPDGTIITKEEYDVKKANNESVYISAFVGCTYHCG